jgi:Domain of unknown function (DUF4288)
MKRYAAKLLFQFRVRIGAEDGKRRLCEVRTVLISARSARSALVKAKKNGRDGEHSYSNSDGNPVFFEFVGVEELLELGAECEPQEVWYDIVERLLPMERKDRLIPAETKLNAIRNELGPGLSRSRVTTK